MHPLREELKKHAGTVSPQNVTRFFRTGNGQYAEHDMFWGLRMPQVRSIAKQFAPTETEVTSLLCDPVHEVRMTAFQILLCRYRKEKSTAGQHALIDTIIAHIQGLNNWDLIDAIVPATLGSHYVKHPLFAQQLRTWQASGELWLKRAAVLATMPAIKEKNFTLFLEFAVENIEDRRDLIQKATGWLLRELGKRDVQLLRTFLDTHAAVMPRTMLRYSIEHLPPDVRHMYMQKKAS